MTHLQHITRALVAGQSVGLTAGAMMPPFFRAAARLGLPVRPLHFMSIPGLLAFTSLGVALVLVMAYAATAGLGDPVELIRRIAENGVIRNILTLAVLVGAATTLTIRFQAFSRELPRWRDL
jgi:hypothetical protein